jgi:hypothetical protein
LISTTVLRPLMRSATNSIACSGLTFSTEEIVAELLQVDVLLSQGRSVGEAVRSIGVMQFTY